MSRWVLIRSIYKSYKDNIKGKSVDIFNLSIFFMLLILIPSAEKPLYPPVDKS